MHLIFYALSVLTVFAYADPHLGQLIGKALQAFPKKLPHSSSVPFWQYADVDPFLCEQTGYFPDTGNCKYYYQCVTFMPGHLVRYVYQCDEDRVYADQDKSCVIPTENERAKCDALDDKKQDKMPKQTTESNEDIDISLLTEQPFIIDTDNDRFAAKTITNSSDFVGGLGKTDTKDDTSIIIPDKLDYPVKNTYLDKGSNFETITKIIKGSTEPEAIGIAATIQDSAERKAIGFKISVQNSPKPEVSGSTGVKAIGIRETTPDFMETETIGITKIVKDSPKTEAIGITTVPSSEELEAIEIPTTVSGSTEPAKIEITKAVQDSTEPTTIEITTIPGSTTPEAVESAKPVQDSSESEAVGITIVPGFTGLEEIETTETTKPTKAIGITITGYEQSGCVDEGFFGDLENCSKFYRCVQFAFKFIKYEFSCPRGTIWDDRLKTCNFRAAVREVYCKDSNKYPLFPFAEQKAVNPADNSKDRVSLVCPTGFRQHPNYCNAFYQCIVNENLEYHLTVFLCPVGSIFDEGNIRCSRDQSIRRNSCVNLEIGEKQLSSRILKHSGTTMCPTDGRFQYGGGCTSNYLHCKRDQLGLLEGYLFHCPEGQLFSPTENKCVSSTLSSLCNYY